MTTRKRPKRGKGAGVRAWKDRTANAIADYLTRDAGGKFKVHRLVIEYEGGPKLSGPGWCREAIADVVRERLVPIPTRRAKR